MKGARSHRFATQSDDPVRIEEDRQRGSSALQTPRRRNYSRWRTATLIGVYVLAGLHIAHWRMTGRTLAPLELNEVMYTLELGIVTAGFLLMATMCVATAVFGRFFCSWGCHILALEDLCAWLLSKARIRPKPVRSRLLLWTPSVAMFYMFLWPQLDRLTQGQPLPKLHFASDTDGWASFTTSDFWRNLPDPWIAMLTFAVCGFAIVYALGSRAFCTYGCPYGALFGLLDRVAPGRIRATGDCSNCGICTSVCQSHVRVHDELQEFGTVVNPACLKDLDCVAACPNGRISYGFALPPVVRSRFSLRTIRLAYDFTLGEEILLASAFVVTLIAFRGLYDSIPFLLSLALGGIAGYAAILCWRLFARRDVRLNGFQLKRLGRITQSGAVFLSCSSAFAGLTAHSLFIRHHEREGAIALEEVERDLASGANASPTVLELAASHLESYRRFGLFQPPSLERALARVREIRGDDAEAERILTHLLERHPGDRAARLALGRVLARMSQFEAARSVLRQGLVADSAFESRHRDSIRFTAAAQETLGEIAAGLGDRVEARAAFEAALAAEPNSIAGHCGLAAILAEDSELDAAAAHLTRAVELRPFSAEARYNLSVVLMAAGRRGEALGQLRAAVELAPSDADVRNNLGFLLVESDDAAAAEPHLRRAVELDPTHAAAHYNLARALLARGMEREAMQNFEAAHKLDARYGAAPGTQPAQH